MSTAKDTVTIVIQGDEKLSPAINKAKSALSGLERSSKRVMSAFSRLARASLGVIRRMLSLKTALFSLLGIGGVGYLGKEFLEAAGDMETYRTRLIAMTKNVEVADAKLLHLKKYAAKAPFELPDIVEAGVRAEAFGLIIEKNIVQIGDLAAFMGEDIPQAAAALGRAFAGGAGAADLLRDRGVLTLVKEFARLKYGIEDIHKLTLPEFREVLLETLSDPDGKIAGATARLAKDFKGIKSMFSDAVFSMKQAIGNALMPVIKKLYTDRLIPLIKKIAEWATVNRSLIQTKFDAFLKTLIKGLKDFWDVAQDVIPNTIGLFGGMKAAIEQLKKVWDEDSPIGKKIGKIIGAFDIAMEDLAYETKVRMQKWINAFTVTLPSGNILEDTAKQIDDVKKRLEALHPMIEKLRSAWRSLPRDISAAGIQIAKNLPMNAVNTFAGSTSNALSDLITGAKTAKEAFKDFAANIINDLVRMSTQFMVWRAITGVASTFAPAAGVKVPGIDAPAQPGVGGFGPGFFTPFKEFAMGGIVTRPTLGLVGEGRYNEAVVPLPDGRNIPVNLQGGISGGSTQVVNYYEVRISAVDSESLEKTFKRGEGIMIKQLSRHIRRRGELNDVIKEYAT